MPQYLSPLTLISSFFLLPQQPRSLLYFLVFGSGDERVQRFWLFFGRLYLRYHSATAATTTPSPFVPLISRHAGGFFEVFHFLVAWDGFSS